MTDQEIIQAIKNGSDEPVKTIYLRYREEFVNWLTNQYACDRENALEIFQLSVVIFYDNLIMGKLKSLTSSLKSYLFAIGKNKAKELQRRQNRFGFELKEELIEQIQEEEPQEIVKQSDIIMMQKSLNKLGDACKQVLQLFYYQNFSMQEISIKMNYKNTGTAKNMKYKCLKRLQTIFNSQVQLSK